MNRKKVIDWITDAMNRLVLAPESQDDEASKALLEEATKGLDQAEKCLMAEMFQELVGQTPPLAQLKNTDLALLQVGNRLRLAELRMDLIQEGR